MYLRHFALTRFPFHDNLDTDQLFDSAAITEAETRLHHLLELKGIGLLTGEVGSGKTTVCRKLTNALHSGLYRVCYVTLSTGHVMDVYKTIAWELGLPTERNRAGASRSIRSEISRLVIEAKQQPILVVDEAHQPCATTCSKSCDCSLTITWTPTRAYAYCWSASRSCADDCP